MESIDVSAGDESPRGRPGSRRLAVALVLGLLSVVGVAYPSFSPPEDALFEPAPGSPVAAAAWGATTGYFDGDTDLDLAVTNGAAGGAVSILLGAGDGTFAPAAGSPVAVGSAPRAVTTGLIDDDAHVDLAVVDFLDHDVSILLGNGNGTFAPAPGSPIPVGERPNSVAAGHFDDDTDLDLAVANGLVNSVSILLGNGDGTFTPAPTLSLGNLVPTSLTTGRFDGDTDLDLAIGTGQGRVLIELGNGDGTFTGASAFEAGGWVAAGHFDADAHLDLAASDADSATVSIHLGNGDGTFASAPGSPYAVGVFAHSVTTGQFDDDAALDLAVAAEGSNSLFVLLGNGDGTFAPAPGSPFAVGDRPWSVTAGCFDDDTDVDLAIANSHGGSVTILLNTTRADNGRFRPAPDSPVAVSGGPAAAATGDFDGDANLDLAVCERSGDRISILLGNGDGSYEPGPSLALDVTMGPVMIATGTFDGDGNLDLVVALEGRGRVAVFLGGGDGTFAIAPGSPWIAGQFGVRAVATGLFDGDADLDLAVGDRFSNNMAIYLGNGDGSFTELWRFGIHTPWEVKTGTFDDDVHLDLAVTNVSNRSVSILLGAGDGHFQLAPGSPITVGALPTSVTTGYFDADADQDLAVVNSEDDNVSILLGNGDGTFTPAPGSPFAVGDYPESMTVGHFDADADPDLAVVNSQGNDVWILLGNGDGTFALSPHSPIAVGAFPTSVAADHVDDDTDLDLVVCNRGSNQVSILLAVSLDATAPTTTIALTPGAPDGDNDWYTSLAVAITADDGEGSGVAETRCALDPDPVPLTFDDLPAECTSTGDIADGARTLYAASADLAGNEETPVSVSFQLDATPPTVTSDVAAPGPVFLLQGPGGPVTATVTDATSGPVQSSVSASADVTSVGNKTVQLTGTDEAGNTTTVASPYRVKYRFTGFLSPFPQSSYRRGSTIPVKFRLANAAGVNLPDAAAQALLAPVCRVKVTLDGAVQNGCATYDPTSDTFQFDVKLSRTIPLGTHSIGIQVSAPDGSGVVNTDSTSVVVR